MELKISLAVATFSLLCQN